MEHHWLVSPVVYSLWKTCEGFLHQCPDEQYLIEYSYLEDIIPKIGYNPRGGRGQVGGQFKQYGEDLKSRGLPEEIIQAVHKVIRLNHIDYEVRQVSRRFTSGT